VIKLCAKHLTPEKWIELKRELGIMNADVLEVEVRGATVFDSFRQEELLERVK
jgi:hypothetical protein